MRIFLFLLLFPLSLSAENLTFSNVRVIDGDTLAVTLGNLPPPLNKLSIRLSGIDTPELKGKCAKERVLAVEAKVFLQNLLTGNTVTVKDYSWDKYGGRILGKVYLLRTDVANLMLLYGYAVPYFGQGPKNNWCL